MAGNPTGKGELAEETLHPKRISRDVRIELGIRALEPGVRHYGRTTVSRATDEYRIGVACGDDSRQVRVEEVEAGTRAPVADQPRFGVLWTQRLAHQGIIQ